jgi:hypothetical protein
MTQIIKDEIAYDINEFNLRFVATYLVEPKGDALIEIFKGDTLVKSFLFPAYKIWNIPAHANDIAAEIEEGLRVAGSTGLGGNVYQSPIETSS